MKIWSYWQHCANISIIAIAATCITACGGEKKDSGSYKDLTFNKVKANKTAKLIESDGNSPECKVSINLQSVASKDKASQRIDSAVVEQVFTFTDTPMQQAADSFVNIYTDNYRKEYTTFYKEDGEAAKARYSFVYEVDGKAEEGYKQTLMYNIHSTIFEGGAHPLTTDLTLNFNTKTGDKITLRDIIEQGKEGQLSQKLLEQLLKDKKMTNIKELNEAGYLQNSDLYPTDNFKLGKDAITFIYNPYEIASYDKGKTEITLKYDDIKDLLNKEYK